MFYVHPKVEKSALKIQKITGREISSQMYWSMIKCSVPYGCTLFKFDNFWVYLLHISTLWMCFYFCDWATLWCFYLIYTEMYKFRAKKRKLVMNKVVDSRIIDVRRYEILLNFHVIYPSNSLPVFFRNLQKRP